MTSKSKGVGDWPLLMLLLLTGGGSTGVHVTEFNTCELRNDPWVFRDSNTLNTIQKGDPEDLKRAS